MSTDILRNDLRDRLAPTLTVSIALAALAAFALSIGASLGDTLDELTQSFPEALTAFIGADAPGGYVVSELFELIAPFALIAFGVTAGTAVVAGEEQRGTMSMLAAQPPSRSSILLAKTLSVFATLVFATGVFWATIAGTLLVIDLGLAISNAAAASVHLLALAVFFASVSLATGAATGRSDLALAAGGGLAVLSYLTKSMLPLAGLDGWAQLSPWYYYSGGDPLREGLDFAHLGILAGLTAIALVVAFRAFNARDLKG